MMAVLQITFIGLISLEAVNPCYGGIRNMWLVNGYNSLSQESHLPNQELPHQPKGIFLYSDFLLNYNLTVLIIVIPLMVALVSFIYFYLKYKKRVHGIPEDNLDAASQRNNEIQSAKVEKFWQRSLGEYTFTGVMFSEYFIDSCHHLVCIWSW